MKSTSIPIRAIGNYLPQDKNGFIINDLSIEKIDKKWLPILEIITTTYHQELGENLVSVYIRGSVPRNLAVDNISDLDTFALVKPAFSDNKIRWQKANFEANTFQIINNKYSFINGLEMNLATFDEAFLNSNLAMIIKTQALLLTGKNISKQLKSYQPNEEMMLHKYWLKTDINDFLKINKDNFELENCSQIMKVILRSGFELVMERVGNFSPDLYICYQDFSKFYPQKKAEMYQVLNWYLNPISNKLLLNNFINEFGKWLLFELKIAD